MGRLGLVLRGIFAGAVFAVLGTIFHQSILSGLPFGLGMALFSLLAYAVSLRPSQYYDPVPVTYPNKAYGFSKRPKSETLLFKNATVWTNEEAGILNNTDVLVVNGKIAAIGSSLEAQGARIIDATAKHLTTGIVDEHSHLGASSINEGGHNSSAEVSIEDVLEPDDIGLYRDLAGGVTTIQILHGSANPIGGRSAIIKLKWGEAADNLIIKNADPFIKFALGENVKQSNWGSFSRFPQTRMGVEQVFTDYFQRARIRCRVE